MMEKKLHGKVALVTGAGGLIGRDTVRRLAEAGAGVAAADIVISDELNGLVREIAAGGGKAVVEKLDITDSREAASVFQDVERRLGPVDILVNNAGVVRGKSEAFHRTAEEYWKRLIEVNLFGTMICTRQALGGMIARRYGRIINIASIAGVSGLPGWADYAASKGGVIMFSETVAMEVGKYGITVNCISPGMIGKEAKPSEGTWLGRTGTAADISNMVVYLASPEADFITGSNYMVDGGRVVGPKNAGWNE